MTSVIHTAPVVLPIVTEPIADGAVLVEDGVIAEVGPAADLTARHPGTPVRTWRGTLLPGLVNAHTHLQYTDFEDLATEPVTSFVSWIKKMGPRRQRFTDQMWADSAKRGADLLLSSGTTACADIVTDACVLDPVAESGLTGVSYLEVVLADDKQWAAASRAQLLDVLDRPSGRVLGISPHALYTVGTAVFRELVDLAHARDLRLHPHLSESEDEVVFVRDGTGPLAALAQLFGRAYELVGMGSTRSPAAQLAEIGGLGPSTHVAHGVHCDAADRSLFRAHGVSVALCVRSNAVLGVGAPPVADYLEDSVPVAIGTDSLASSPSLDLLDEARAVRELALRQGYRHPDLDQRVVEAATRGGALAMGAADFGVLSPGARADLAVFDTADGQDPYQALLDSGKWTSTIIAGEIVRGKTL